MQKALLRTSAATLYYSRGDQYHESTPGRFYVWDEVMNRKYWEQDCYDGGDGWANLDERIVQINATAMFIELCNIYGRQLSPQDRAVLAPYHANGTLKDTWPPPEKTIKEVTCPATWQIEKAVDGYTVKCRRCGVYVCAGGTPKCLLNESKSTT